MNKFHGRVKWFDYEKGFGFISLPGIDQDIFFHISEVEDRQSVFNNESVAFVLASNEKGLIAKNIEIQASTGKVSNVQRKTLHARRSSDDRLKCTSCGKKMVPRIVFSQGEPDYSICPFCMSTVRHYFETNPVGETESTLRFWLRELFIFLGSGILIAIGSTIALLAILYFLLAPF